MRNAFVRRTVLSASAVSLALLVSACGGSGDSGAKPDAKSDAKASAPASSAPAAKGKTDAELAPLLITEAEAPGFVVVADAARKLAAGDAVKASTDKPECKVLVQSQALQKIGTPTGTARMGVAAKPKEDPNATAEQKVESAFGVTATMIGLASYDGKGAEELVASLKTAGTACAGGFTATADGDTTKYESVAGGTGAPVSSGDDSVSLVLTVDLEDGEKAVSHLTVLRTGSTVATFSSLSLMGKTESPVTLVAAQSAKLG